MNETINRGDVDEAVHKLVDSNIRCRVGLIDIPEGAVDDRSQGYAVVTPIPSGSYTDDSGQPLSPPLIAGEDAATVEYDVAAVGHDRRQAQWVATRVREIMLGPLPLEAHGHVEIGRSPAGPIGAVTLVDGVWQAVESYRVTVQRI